MKCIRCHTPSTALNMLASASHGTTLLVTAGDGVVQDFSRITRSMVQVVCWLVRVKMKKKKKKVTLAAKC